jgi:polyisoprenoid-binding protein YceI
MLLKKSVPFLLGLSLSWTSLSAWAKGVESRQLVAAESQVKWIGEKVTGTHFGFVGVKSGELQLEKSKLKGGTIVVDMASMTCTDIDNPEYNQKLLAHLKSEDFFSVDKFSEATFSTTKVKTQKNKELLVEGNLTIKGKTLPVSFPATLKKEGDKVSLTGTITFDRTKWDIKYNSGKFFESLGDKMIKDDVKLEFVVVAK